MPIEKHAQDVRGYEFDGFVLDLRRRELRRQDGTPVRLTPRLFNALLLFVEHDGELLGKDWLMSRLWPGIYVVENSLSQVICALRHSLARDGNTYIQTEPRHGFRFVCPVRVLPQIEAAANSAPGALQAVSFTLAVQVVIMKHLAAVLAPYTEAAPHGRIVPVPGGRGYVPARTPAFP